MTIPVGDNSQNPTVLPVGAFWRGVISGIVIALPLVIAGEFFLARIGIGDPEASLAHIAKIALAFAALPAALTAGGVARVAARAALLPKPGRVMAGVARGAAAFAPAGVGLLLLIAIPLGKLPEQSVRWSWLAVVGALVGAIAGALIGRIALLGHKESDDARAG